MSMGTWHSTGALVSDQVQFPGLSALASDNTTSHERIYWEEVVLDLSRTVQNGSLQLGLLVASLLLLAVPLTWRFLTSSSERPARVTFLYKSPIAYDATLQAIVGAVLGLSIVLTVRGLICVAESTLFAYIFGLQLLHTIISRRQNARLRRLFGFHVTILLPLTTFLAFAMDILPTLLVHREITVPRLNLWKFLLLVASLVVMMVSPRTAVRQEHAMATITAASIVKLESKKLPIPSPEEYCSPYSYFMSYDWLSKLVILGCRRPLGLNDLPVLPHYDEPHVWLDNVLEARRKGVTTLKTVLILMRWELSIQAFFAFQIAIADFIAPLAMNRLLSFLDDPGESVFHPGLWVIFLFVGPMTKSFVFQQYIYNSTRLVVRIRSAFTQEIYHKALGSIIFEKLPAAAPELLPSKSCSNIDISETDVNSENELDMDENDEQSALEPEDAEVQGKEEPQEFGDSGVGHIINLMSADVRSIEAARDIVMIAVAVPVQVAIAMTFLYRMLGWSSMAGLAVMMLSLSLPSLVSRKMMSIQRRVMERTDARISMVSEYLSSIRIIKYFGWERAMAEKIKGMRDLEQSQIWRRKLWATVLLWAGDFIPLVTLFVMFATFTLATGQPLRAAMAFTSLSIIDTIRQQFNRTAELMGEISQTFTSFKRIDRFFATATPKTKVTVGDPSFKAATFRRSPSGPFRLQNLDITFLPGRLNVITGPTGSGKTSMLLSLLGETILESGEVICPRDVAYVSQTAWLQSGTVQENIIFHSAFDEVRYNATVQACGLTRDLEELPHGDQTQVAEQGAVLSGGQQQRVALARAVYSSASTLLLDDVFSALDIHTTNLIFDEFFRKGFLGERTVILVSYMPALIDVASLVVRIESGRVIDVTKKPDTTSEITKPDAQIPVDLPPISGADFPGNEPKPAVLLQKKLEETAKGRIPRGLFFQYLLCFGGYPYALLILLTAFSAQVIFFSVTLWLSVWTGAYSKDGAIDLGFYLGVYGSILLVYNFMLAATNFAFQYGSWKAATKLHLKLVDAVLNVPIRWFDSQAIGTILNRFSTDMQVLDTRLVSLLRTTLNVQIRLVLRIGSIASIMPIFALPAAILCSVGFVVGEMYTRAQISIKRLTSSTQSPIFAHFSETLTGLPTIRAQSGMKETFGLILADRVRNNSRAYEALFNSNRWVSVRADAVAATVGACAGVIAIMKAQTISAGLVGFSLTNAIGLSGTILGLVRNMNELEVELNSFQRVIEYTNLKSETEENVEFAHEASSSQAIIKPPASWPTKGDVKIQNFSAAYTRQGPDVLKDITLQAQAGERIGIVGRTGSGKSSLALSLLRFTKATGGSIFIDNIDTSNIKLADLRRAVTIIPQEPTLFAGDVRANLDPFDELDETDLNAALRACNFINTSPDEAAPDTKDINIEGPDSSSSSSSNTAINTSTSTPKPTSLKTANPDTAITLSTPVATDGSNFSRGQRQILSMARAICRRSKIVILDEATSSVDDETDDQIQRVLRTEFPGSTIFTIAHRLKTIMDYDRVVVMGEGRILEVGSPAELLGIEGGIFAGMVGDMGKLGRGAEGSS